MSKIKLKAFDAADYLSSEEDMQAYLQGALEDGDPKRLAAALGDFAKARGMARHFRSGLDTMMREAELEELEKQWREQNDAIMREFPRVDGAVAQPMIPATSLPPACSARM